MKNKIVILSSFVIGLALGILSVKYLRIWPSISSDFFSVTLIDIIKLIIYCVIGFYISFFLTQRFSNERKNKEIILNLLDELNNLLITNELNIIGFMKLKSDKSEQREILLILRKINNKISTLKSIELSQKLKNFSSKLNEIEVKFKELKENLTGDEWSIIENYDNATIDKSKMIFPLLFKQIDEAKTKIF